MKTIKKSQKQVFRQSFSLISAILLALAIGLLLLAVDGFSPPK